MAFGKAKHFECKGSIITQRDTLDVFFKLPLQEDGTPDYAALQYSVKIFKNRQDTLSVLIKAAQALQIDFTFKGEAIRMISTNNYFGFKSGLVKPTLIFLKVELQGRATLCSYYDPTRLTSRQDYSPKHYYVLYQRGKTYLQVSPLDIYLAVSAFFNDCDRFAELDEKDIIRKEIPYWVKEYNDGNCNKD
jgi:hypothetical protein